MILCPDCKVLTGYDEDDWPQYVNGPGCRGCGGLGEVDGNRIAWSPRMLLNPTVQDLIDFKRRPIWASPPCDERKLSCPD